METSPVPEEVNTKNDLKFRESLYRMIISQLFYDGYQQLAVGLSGQLQVHTKAKI
jgi:cleavage stimulation factor subunit 1